MAVSQSGWDLECDALVVGSGAGALTGALTMASAGLRTIVIEKTDVFGGTTTYAGAGLWFPNNQTELAAGVPDTPALAREYVAATVGDRTPARLQEAYLAAGPEVIEFLSAIPPLKFKWEPFPDYFGTLPGAFPVGRAIFPVEINAVEVGDDVARIRNRPFNSMWPNDPAVLTGGRALVARLLVALRRTDADLRLNTALDRLVTEEGVVVGVEATTSEGRLRIRAHNGVLLACGGYEANAELRAEYQPQLSKPWTLGAPGNTGDGHKAATEIGASTDLLEESWWTPATVSPEGEPGFLMGLTHGIIVNGDGKRFANESLPYDRFGHEMLRDDATGVRHLPAYLVTDSASMRDFGIDAADIPPAETPPGEMSRSLGLASSTVPPEWLDSGRLIRADSIEELAELIQVPAEELARTVERYNAFVQQGIDEDFHRGEDPFDRFCVFLREADGVVSDLSVEVLHETITDNNRKASLVPLVEPPFYATQIVLGDLGTKGGLRCDENARVLRDDDTPIEGLYAAGNTMASWTGHVYPGPGAPIGTSMAFSFVAARHMASSYAPVMQTAVAGPIDQRE